ncbi:VOC family protein [Rhodoblastus acidophilus]|uniref:VOC family protein n=1 Tax=Candidatus Rhodoblastus alkanivorans TaxID=2954117 RepID=A0ABS9Z112_9HYPH|nr:VOC family protein [Candidatus Rhodoblastus alkanivorans]MCI4678253.1 VOC family protein [Candidatus Rhodoblastus alkanivorans]MCI4681303.1 VOC family protein [Candidatus Rhodoblastus alkanivorans]MDI4642350.1 VOC family protein [Rhodoblastus acidophilus]
MAEKFCWVELLTSDIDAAEAFYDAVFGWTCAAPGHATRDYRMFFHEGAAVAGLMLLPEEAKAQGARPSWFGYVTSPDVDADVAAIVATGGQLFRAPETLEKIGRFAVVGDPQGAPFALWRDLTGIEAPEAPPMTVGHVGWHELFTDDVEKAFAFYSARFGWTKGDALDMGPMGVYQLFATGGAPVGGMMKRTPEMPHPFWNYYFTVAALDATLEKVTTAGGRIAREPTEVPGGAWIAQCFDPQGAFFSIVAAKR